MKRKRVGGKAECRKLPGTASVHPRERVSLWRLFNFRIPGHFFLIRQGAKSFSCFYHESRIYDWERMSWKINKIFWRVGEGRGGGRVGMNMKIVFVRRRKKKFSFRLNFSNHLFMNEWSEELPSLLRGLLDLINCFVHSLAYNECRGACDAIAN